ncbi:hypothetical protein C8R48DRAFT_595815, partial [Suillus tomentosus]
LLSITCDNVSNNNVMIDDLEALVPIFGGSMSHTRCFLHMVNLVAKSLIHEFDVMKKDADRVLDRGPALMDNKEDVMNELTELSTIIDCKEVETGLDVSKDNIEGWVDEVAQLLNEEHLKLQ